MFEWLASLAVFSIQVHQFFLLLTDGNGLAGGEAVTGHVFIERIRVREQ